MQLPSLFSAQIPHEFVLSAQIGYEVISSMGAQLGYVGLFPIMGQFHYLFQNSFGDVLIIYIAIHLSWGRPERVCLELLFYS